MEKFDTDLSTLHPVLTECRILKSDMELALIQYANDVSSEAHVEVTLARKLLLGNPFLERFVNWMAVLLLVLNFIILVCALDNSF